MSTFLEEEPSSRFQTAPASPILELPNGASIDQVQRDPLQAETLKTKLQDAAHGGHSDTFRLPIPAAHSPASGTENDGFPFFSKGTSSKLSPTNNEFENTDYQFKPIVPSETDQEQEDGGTDQQSPRELGRKSISFAQTPSDVQDSQRSPSNDTTYVAGSDGLKSLMSRFISRRKSLGMQGTATSDSNGQDVEQPSDTSNSDNLASGIDGNPSQEVTDTPNLIDGRPVVGLKIGTRSEMSEDPPSPETAGKPRRIRDGSHTEPTTPKRVGFPSEGTSTPGALSEHRQFFSSSRSSSQAPPPIQQQQSVSEDEARTRLDMSGWRQRSSAWVQSVRQTSQNAARRTSTQDTPGASRPSNLRRITGKGMSLDNAEGSQSAWRVKSQEGAQRWRQIRANLKLMVRERRKAANLVDHTKSAELVAELLAGSPAALILASKFQPDEGQRIPVLLEQLKISITDSQVKEGTVHERNPIFRIELEYGSGIMRMKWTIYRSLKDFWALHGKYAAEASLQRFQRHRSGESSRVKLPRFPRTAFPYFRDARGLAAEEEEDEDEGDTGDDGNDTDKQTPTSKHKRRRSSIGFQGRRSSTENVAPFSPSTDAALGGEARNLPSANKGDRYAERSRKKLETYLRNLVRFVIFRPGSNRMCRFLELSALGVRLAVEGGYHGKEGRLLLQSGKGIDFRRSWVPDLMIQRHKPMWFLVRHSYIVCVDSPADMYIYDVILVDSDFAVTPKRARIRDQKRPKDIAKTAGHAARHPQHHALRIANSERKLKLLADSERQMTQFEESIKFMLDNTEWAKPKRFSSFAPVRKNVFAQWLVDGRDYMWNVSRALNMARDVIYIHDWWLSPELYMRRPGPISHKWRLDRILKRKAEEGVKIFVIVYRNINSAIPIDSEYTKFALLDLHPNIFVQRSPNQVRQNVFFWAHHEKLCIIDHTILFCGGIDLCYGRWDTPSHSVVDDRPTGWEPTEMPLNADTCQLWPGKDYSNARAGDFFRLDEPFSEMYDRTRVPRMPWHDIGLQVVGQPARDATRHFIQRWNYILRQRKPSRPTPFLLPPPDFKPGDLEALGLEGTCTVQVLRSASDWSIGTPKTEHSIMNAYCKLIETSEHFVYIENQFFVTSCVVEGTRVHNAIGDALVERIIRAHRNEEDWLAVIIVPLMPGFENAVDAQDGTSVRLIMQSQYRSISRGSTSIFERVRAAGVNPEDYISFYALRSWGKIGPTKAIVTEQLYIHAKCMVVDDRHAIIGSANINERSMLGDRDSEVACVIFDTDMIDSVMAGEPYKVGRFPHSLRMRLMREHLGIDVDHIMQHEKEEETESQETLQEGADSESRRSSSLQSAEMTAKGPLATRAENRVEEDLIAKELNVHTFNHDADWVQENNPHLKTNKAITADRRVTNTLEHKQDVEGHGIDNMYIHEHKPEIRGRDTVLMNGREVMVNDVSSEGHGSIAHPSQAQQNGTKGTFVNKLGSAEGTVKARLPPPRPPRLHTQELGLTLVSQLPPLPITDDTDIGGPPLQRSFSAGSADTINPILSGMRRPIVEKNCMRDPLNDAFFRDTWNTVAKNNTRLFRQVFRCMPDSEVTTWAQYHAAVAHAERFNLSQGMSQGNTHGRPDAPARGGPVGHGLQQSQGATATTEGNMGKTNGSNDSPATDEKGSLQEEKSTTDKDKLQERHSNQSLDLEQASGAEKDPATLNEKLEPGSSSPPKTTGPDAESMAAIHQSTTFASTDRDNSTINSHLTATDTKTGGNQKRRRRATTRSSGPPPRASDTVLSKADAEELMKLVQGHLVEWPYDWLSHEERGGKWLYSVDQMAPMEIYD